MSMRAAAGALFLSLVSLAACGGPGGADGGADSGVQDGGVDSGAQDGGAGDANAGGDAGRMDAGGADAQGSTDAGAGSSDGGADGGADSSADSGAQDGGAGGEWLRVVGNHIVMPDGSNFHGRGANLHDTRSCEACSFQDADPAGVNRWADQLIDVWHANFIRFLLASKAAPYNQYEVQWQNLVDDQGYYQDIQTIVNHMTSKPGVYVLVTLFADPTIKDNNSDPDSEWPTAATMDRYRLLAEAFYDNPRVLFGLTNEPHGPESANPMLAQVYQQAVDTIRTVENAHGTPHHIVVVQAPQGWARDLSYFVSNPMPGDNIAYEIHPYNHQSDFDALITQPAATLPVIIGEYGPADFGSGPVMTTQDIQALWALAQSLEVPHIAWNFHQRCPPDMLQDTASDGCGLSASTGYNFPRTAWGDLMFNYLNTAW